MTPPVPSDDSPFSLFTTLPVSDAHTLLAQFEEAGVRFEFAPERSELENTDAFIASMGGISFGRGEQFQIFTHRDDAEAVERIWRGFCGLES
jgi:hypothetical protein